MRAEISNTYNIVLVEKTKMSEKAEEENAKEVAAAMMEDEEVEEPPKTSLFPLLFPSETTSIQTIPNIPQWLSNTSFKTDLSVINDAVSSRYNDLKTEVQEEDESEETDKFESKPSTRYELLDSSASDGDSDQKEKKERKKRRHKKKRRRHGGEDDAAGDYPSSRRNSGVGSWAGAASVSIKPTKEYYFDSRGDRDNLAFGCLYRMDVARFKLFNSAKISGIELQALYKRNKRGSILDRDGDIDKLDAKLKSDGRYWSAKYSALERHKNLKHVRIVAPKKSATTTPPDDFIPLSSIVSSREGSDSRSNLGTSVVEESWEDEVLRKTREFNKMSREHPHDERNWLAFADFQDRVASMQPQKGARLQTLEKKISILEKAIELNQENEELLLCLLKAYQSRDSTDVLIGRWEKILMQHSGSCRLWKEFLRVVQGEFSRFKVSEMRKMYIHAIQALSSVCSKQYGQVYQTAGTSQDLSIVKLELGLIDIFVSLCRFEWQAGYQELATALFQAEIEYSLFCPSLYLTEQSKQRLFEHFWNADGARVGEEGALGWATWLAKEEEHRQKVIKEENSHETEEGGWTGWTEPLSKHKEATITPANVDGEFEEELETEDSKQEDDTEALLKMLGIDVNAEADGEIKDTSTWSRWSEEESVRDCDQWMPIRAKTAGVSHTDASPEIEADEQLTRVILFEDVSEFLFSLSSVEARLSLICQFIDFFGGKISQWICSNSSSWTEKLLSLETLPDSVLDDLRRVLHILNIAQSSKDGFNLESLVGSSINVSGRTSMMKFLRNAILLCLAVFPRNYVLEEAALVAEDLSITKMNSCSCSVTPCRALAKWLLKCDRQDVLLCGVYAQREAAFGKIDHARKVFDMALASIEGLPSDLQSDAPLLYFWYAEVEIANTFGNSAESSLRAIHILSFLGSGVRYSPFKCQPSSVQLLRAHQGYKEQIRTLRSAWARGAINDSSIALICSAALFEELTTGGAAGVEVLDQAFSMVLPEGRRQSYKLEYLFDFYVRMLQKHCKQSRPSKVWKAISQGLQIYPFNPKFFSSLVEIGHLYSVPNKLRWIFDDFCQKKPSVIVWLFALSYEISRGGSQHRIHALFERAFENDRLRSSVILWRCYIAYEINVICNLSAARRIFFRAIHACPWSKKLWLDGFLKLSSILTAKELSDLQEVMRDKELNLRTDIYEILLQDESKSSQ